MEVLKEAAAPGSCLITSHGTADGAAGNEIAAVTAEYGKTATPLTLRTRAEVERFFDGWHLQDPGVAGISRWNAPVEGASRLTCYGGVAFKPDRRVARRHRDRSPAA